MATAGIQKICVVCGKDVSTQPRVKDAQGRYHCNPCWVVRNAPAVPTETASRQDADANNHRPPQSSTPIGESGQNPLDGNRSTFRRVRNWRSTVGKVKVLLVHPLSWCGIHADDWADWMWVALLISIPVCLIVLTSLIILIVVYNSFLPFVGPFVIIPTIVVYAIRSSNRRQPQRNVPAARATDPVLLILIAFAVLGGWLYFHSDNELPSLFSKLTTSFVNNIAGEPNPAPSQAQQQQPGADADAAAKLKAIDDANARQQAEDSSKRAANAEAASRQQAEIDRQRAETTAMDAQQGARMAFLTSLYPFVKQAQEMRDGLQVGMDYSTYNKKISELGDAYNNIIPPPAGEGQCTFLVKQAKYIVDEYNVALQFWNLANEGHSNGDTREWTNAEDSRQSSWKGGQQGVDILINQWKLLNPQQPPTQQLQLGATVQGTPGAAPSNQSLPIQDQTAPTIATATQWRDTTVKTLEEKLKNLHDEETHLVNQMIAERKGGDEIREVHHRATAMRDDWNNQLAQLHAADDDALLKLYGAAVTAEHDRQAAIQKQADEKAAQQTDFNNRLEMARRIFHRHDMAYCPTCVGATADARGANMPHNSTLRIDMTAIKPDPNCPTCGGTGFVPAQ
jgi:hypothetical protein